MFCRLLMCAVMIGLTEFRKNMYQAKMILQILERHIEHVALAGGR